MSKRRYGVQNSDMADTATHSPMTIIAYLPPPVCQMDAMTVFAADDPATVRLAPSGTVAHDTGLGDVFRLFESVMRTPPVSRRPHF